MSSSSLSSYLRLDYFSWLTSSHIFANFTPCVTLNVSFFVRIRRRSKNRKIEFFFKLSVAMLHFETSMHLQEILLERFLCVHIRCEPKPIERKRLLLNLMHPNEQYSRIEFHYNYLIQIILTNSYSEK